MDEAVLVHRLPTVDEFIALRRAAGWNMPDPDAIAEAMRNTLFAVCIEVDGRFVGSGRVVGDGALVCAIQDVIVLPEHQRKGYGTMIMDALMDYVDNHAAPTAHISLFAAKGMEAFYSRYGFVERPQGRLGPGMAFIKK